jgi:ACS family pantothenate transporter-like MFS transporter
MDLTSTTQAYVSGTQDNWHRMGLSNWFQVYFPIAYAMSVVPSQMLQMRLRPSLRLLCADIGWGIVELL